MDGERGPSGEKPEDKIVRLMRGAAPSAKVAENSEKLGGNVISLFGNGNVVAGRDVHVSISSVPRPKTVVQTGDGVIDAKQKADLKSRLFKWLEARNAVRVRPMTPQAAWSSFNRAMQVNSYAELTPEQLPDAIKWLTRQKAIVNSMKSAPVKVSGFRSDTMKAIKARARQLGDLHFYTPHIVKTYGVSSLAHLSDVQLQEVRAWIFRQKK